MESKHRRGEDTVTIASRSVPVKRWAAVLEQRRCGIRPTSATTHSAPVTQVLVASFWYLVLEAASRDVYMTHYLQAAARNMTLAMVAWAVLW